MTTRVMLWGGPEDGRYLDVENQCRQLRVPVPTSPSLVTFAKDALLPEVWVARYVRVTRYEMHYAGQEPM